MSVVPGGTGEALGDDLGGLQILEDGTHTHGGLSVIRGVLAAGSEGPPQHVHRKHSETFYVLAGTVRFTSTSDHLDVSAEGLFTASIAVPHTFANPSSTQEATFMCLITPSFYVGYFREMAARSAQPAGMDPAGNVELMHRYATDLYR